MVKFGGLITLHGFSKTFRLRRCSNLQKRLKDPRTCWKLNGLTLLYHLNAQESIIFIAATSAHRLKSMLEVPQDRTDSHQKSLIKVSSVLRDFHHRLTGCACAKCLEIFSLTNLVAFSLLLKYPRQHVKNLSLRSLHTNLSKLLACMC